MEWLLSDRDRAFDHHLTDCDYGNNAVVLQFKFLKFAWGFENNQSVRWGILRCHSGLVPFKACINVPETVKGPRPVHQVFFVFSKLCVQVSSTKAIHCHGFPDPGDQCSIEWIAILGNNLQDRHFDLEENMKAGFRESHTAVNRKSRCTGAQS